MGSATTTSGGMYGVVAPNNKKQHQVKKGKSSGKRKK